MVKCINKGCYFCGVFVFYEVFGLKLEVLIKNFYESCDEILKMTQAIKKKLKILGTSKNYQFLKKSQKIKKQQKYSSKN